MSFQRHHSADPEAPEADVLEQEQDVSPDDDEDDQPGTPPTTRVSRDPEVPEADALEQSIDVRYDDDYEG
ncbi:MAG TPA: hypothetical protein VF942_13985 [Acidimicrobiales bacterium]